jgi:hypothetical protein
MKTDETSTLDETQQTRAEALRIARAVIESRGGFTSGLRDDVSAADLVDLAEYIVEGLHPYDRYPDGVAPDDDGGA